MTEEEYNRQGQITLQLPPDAPGPWHISVVARGRTATGEVVHSPGLEPTAQTVVTGPNPEVTVAYTLRRPLRFTRRKGSVVFRTEPPGLAVPPTVLVGHPRTVPLSFDDGETLAHFPAAQDGARFELPPGVDLRKVRARIFPDPRTEPDGLGPVRFRHPETDATRV
ncbi:MAG: hypothetical protein U0794_07190 [Isosphaeraceae bacterium]